MAYGTNAPFGLKPFRRADGTPWNDAMSNPYTIASGYGTAIGYGDPVTTLADGTIGIGVAGAACRGIFMGCKYYNSLGEYVFSRNWVASTTVKTGTTVEALVCDDPNIVMTVQETDASGNAGTALALADIGLNINFRVGTPDALGNSTTSINNASEATGATLNLKILGLDPTVGNQVGDYANWLVTWNNHQFKGGTGTAGV
jgi:hypothetical protein